MARARHSQSRSYRAERRNYQNAGDIVRSSAASYKRQHGISRKDSEQNIYRGQRERWLARVEPLGHIRAIPAFNVTAALRGYPFLIDTAVLDVSLEHIKRALEVGSLGNDPLQHYPFIIRVDGILGKWEDLEYWGMVRRDRADSDRLIVCFTGVSGTDRGLGYIELAYYSLSLSTGDTKLLGRPGPEERIEWHERFQGYGFRGWSPTMFRAPDAFTQLGRLEYQHRGWLNDYSVPVVSIEELEMLVTAIE